MKTLRPLCAAIVLTLMIAISSFAGDMHTTAPTPPPPTSAPAVDGGMHTGNSDGGNIHTGYSDEVTAGEAVVAGALGALQSVLSLL